MLEINSIHWTEPKEWKSVWGSTLYLQYFMINQYLLKEELNK